MHIVPELHRGLSGAPLAFDISLSKFVSSKAHHATSHRLVVVTGIRRCIDKPKPRGTDAAQPGPAVGDDKNMTIPKSLTWGTYMRSFADIDIHIPSRFSSVVEQLAAVQQVIGSNPVADFAFWRKC